MFISNFDLFLLERSKLLLRYQLYDWDDNILTMPTVIHMDKKVDGKWVPEDVSTSKFALVRHDTDNWRLLNGDNQQGYSDFGDNGPRGDKAFYEDSILAIENRKFGPSWRDFINCLVGGKLFAIVTSRHHMPDTMKKVVEWIIYNMLNNTQQDDMINNMMYFTGLFNKDIDYVIDQYLSKCGFFAIGNPLNSYIISTLNVNSKDTPEIKKEIAIKYFKDKLVSYGDRIEADIEVGFSDDDKKISDHIATFMGDEKKLDFLEYKKKKTKTKIDYYVYDTSDPKNVNKIKI